MFLYVRFVTQAILHLLRKHIFSLDQPNAIVTALTLLHLLQNHMCTTCPAKPRFFTICCKTDFSQTKPSGAHGIWLCLVAIFLLLNKVSAQSAARPTLNKLSPIGILLWLCPVAIFSYSYYSLHFLWSPFFNRCTS